MILKSISVGGFKNLHYMSINTSSSNVISIISPNNYGKSNLLEAIRFAIDYIAAGPKQRSTMMAWKNGIPLTPGLANEPFRFEIELENPQLKEYRYIRYGFSFLWYRDDSTGQRIIDEHLDMRANESVKYAAFLKRTQNKYRKGKSTNAFRSMTFSDNVLAIDILSSIEDIEYSGVLSTIHQFKYRVCETLDVDSQFQFSPLSVADEDDKSIRFDDEDVPRALYKLKTLYPDKYLMFEDAIHSLFPEFTQINVQAHELSPDYKEVHFVFAGDKDSLEQQNLDNVPFHLKDTVYRVMITSKNLNQPVSMSAMSTGTKRIFWLLTNIFVASCTEVGCIGIEELETSIHPKMLKNLLEIVSETLDDTRIIISSHSPYLVQYLKPFQIFVGATLENGAAQFLRIRETRLKKLLSAARSYDLSVGEYLFELMSGGNSQLSTLQNYLEVTECD